MRSSAYKAISFGVAVMLWLLGTTVRAEIKNFSFAGNITHVDDHGFLLDSSVTNGAPFEGFYTFDFQRHQLELRPNRGDLLFPAKARAAWW